MKKEAKWQTVFNQYLKEKKWYMFHELKQTNTESFQFAKIESGQDEGLPALEKSGLVYKFSDEISRQKPCDGVSIPPLPSYLVIKFKDGFYCIRYSEIEKMRDSGAIAISKDMAEELSERIIKITK
jgi:hypothetical protein